jgi:hypothetical protein
VQARPANYHQATGVRVGAPITGLPTLAVAVLGERKVGPFDGGGPAGGSGGQLSDGGHQCIPFIAACGGAWGSQACRAGLWRGHRRALRGAAAREPNGRPMAPTLSQERQRLLRPLARCSRRHHRALLLAYGFSISFLAEVNLSWIKVGMSPMSY